MRMKKKDASEDSTPVTVPPWSHGQNKSTQTTRPVAREAAVVARWRALAQKLSIRFNVATVSKDASAAKTGPKSTNKAARECTANKKKKRNRNKGRRMQTVEETQGDEWESVNV